MVSDAAIIAFHKENRRWIQRRYRYELAKKIGRPVDDIGYCLMRTRLPDHVYREISDLKERGRAASNYLKKKYAKEALQLVERWRGADGCVEVVVGAEGVGQRNDDMCETAGGELASGCKDMHTQAAYDNMWKHTLYPY